MRVLTVSGFNEWARDFAPSYYVYSSENNRALKALGITMSEHYRSMSVSSSLTRICFRNTNGTLCLENVKEVHMYDDRESIGVVFDVVCNTGSGRRIWRLIAD